jgi:polysaccharide biosynthesis protein VpsM
LTPTNPKGSVNYLLRAGLQADYETHGDRYKLAYDGAYQRFVSASNENTDNHTLRFDANNIFTARNALDWQVSMQDGFEPRGLDNNSDKNAEPNHFQNTRIGGTYRYGAVGAQGQVEFDAAQSSKVYLNNEYLTRTAEVDALDLGLRFIYRVMPKTSLVFEVRNTDYNYRALDANLDSTEQRFLVGANWSATAATSGYFRFGQTVRNYRETAGFFHRSRFSGPTWEAAVTWKPVTYSRVDFTTNRAVSDTTATDSSNFIVNNSYGLKWTHEWASYLRTELGWSHQDSKYDSSDATWRNDKLNTYRTAVYYDFKRWVKVGLEYTHSVRDSNKAESNYRNNQTMAVVEAKF